MPKLKKYEIHQSEAVGPAEDSVGSGVACSDFVVEMGKVPQPYVVREPYVDTEKYIETIKSKKGKTKKVEKTRKIEKTKRVIKTRMVKALIKTKKPCPGEMMMLQPEQKHPELKKLRRAVCGECNWRGWV